MRMVIAAILFASLLASADDTKPVDAKALVLEAKDLLGKQEGYHLKVKGGYALSEDSAMNYGAETVVKGDLAWSKEDQMGVATESYRKGKKLVTKDPVSGEWSDDAQAGGLPVAGLQDPKAVMGLVDKCADTATLGGEEKIGEVDCTKVVLQPKPEILKEFLQAQGIPDLGIDFTKAKVDFVVWIGKADKLYRRMSLKGEILMDAPPPAAGQQPDPPSKVTATVEVNLFDYNKNLDFEIPDKVKKLLGL